MKDPDDSKGGKSERRWEKSENRPQHQLLPPLGLGINCPPPRAGRRGGGWSAQTPTAPNKTPLCLVDPKELIHVLPLNQGAPVPDYLQTFKHIKPILFLGIFFRFFWDARSLKLNLQSHLMCEILEQIELLPLMCCWYILVLLTSSSYWKAHPIFVI